MRVLADLVYAGEVVGYRVTLKGYRGAFDVSLSDFNLIIHDYELEVSERNHANKIYLEERGTLLVPTNASNAEEMTYASYSKITSNDFMSKTDTSLKELYNKYNKECFRGNLPKLVAVEWSSRMTSGAGVCISERDKSGKPRYTIRLSTPYHNKFPDEVIDTLVHEMIHVCYPNETHGYAFRSTMSMLNSQFGFNITIRATGSATVNFIYACKDCNQKYERVKKLDTRKRVCGKCRGNLYLEHDYTEEYLGDS